MRFIMHSVFAAALIAAPVCSKAAPRNIDDCEKIQAADAYNQCLALFGPVARSHTIARASEDSSNQDAGAADEGPASKVAAAPDEALSRGHDRHHRHGWARHHGAPHHWASHGGGRHGHWHHTTATAHRHGKRTTMAFIPGSGHSHLR